MGEVVTAMKKSSLSTAAQLEVFSLKLKTFNENYKDYL